MKTPYYVFDAEAFRNRLMTVKEELAGTELTYSVKANPFLLYALPDKDLICHVEVCSPGELKICKHLDIDGSRIIFSGVMKEEADVRDAVSFGAGFLTAESLLHYELILKEAERTGREVKVLLRLTSGNQFGMSENDILKILSEGKRPGVTISGIHFYSGTDKKKSSHIEKDILKIEKLLKEAGERYGYKPDYIEYGPGLSAEYYEPPHEEKDLALLREVSGAIRSLFGIAKTGIEMGRFFASGAGSYYTRVCDIKENGGVNYVITDGGIHHLKYFGQNMAMKVPPIRAMRDGVCGSFSEEKKDYCICGSLCTTADVLVRNVSLPELKIGDILEFGRCGAYSVTEGTALFLSRDLPEIWLKDGDETKKMRETLESWKINC